MFTKRRSVYVTVEVSSSLLLLPEQPMMGRLDNPRIGYFTNPLLNYTDGQQRVDKKQFITRWRSAFRILYQSDLLPEARTYLLNLMAKRYTPEAYTAKATAVNAMSKEALVREILNERARELAYEGHRWFDLRRTTRPRLEKVLGGKTFVLEENDARYMLAIPQEAIDANPGLLN